MTNTYVEKDTEEQTVVTRRRAQKQRETVSTVSRLYNIGLEHRLTSLKHTKL